VDLRDLAVADVRSSVAVVFEDTVLFEGTIESYIRFGTPDASEHELRGAARAAGVHDFVSALEDQYATAVGERGASLSGGQRQRVAVARALLAPARVLVLDSATSAVDAVTEVEIRDAIAELARDRTTLLIAYRSSTIELADRVVLLHDGRAADTGTHAELLSRSALYRQVLARGDSAAAADSADVELVS
jgi:ATP-binding cassette subfamily B protein